MTISERVGQLRAWMAAQGIAAYWVPTADPHNNEYIPARWMAREWLTGFTGSAGLAVVTPSQAGLWTDSRYWLQAEEQLDGSPFALMREGSADVPAPETWLARTLQEEGLPPEVAGPADMLTAATAEALEAAGLTLRTDVPNAFDALWTDRPPLPAAPITVQDAEWAGPGVAAKLQRAAQWLNGALAGEAYLFNDLADIAWLLNLRGSDIPYNPVFVAYLIYNKEEARFTLFTHTPTLTPEARTQLTEAGVALEAYESLPQYCHTHRVQASGSVCLDVPALPAAPLESEVARWRAVKSSAEAEGFRQAMLRDGVALVQFLRRLDEQMAAGDCPTEMEVDAQLTALRAAQPGFRELSFATIAGYAAHGAIVHYEAEPATDVRLKPEGLLLLDSGAQFDCGTTDITRTLALGPTTDEERRVYTLVLKGHLALARLRFPEGTTGLQLDTAARQPLWAEGYDFGHGTGHGVGSHLCVHEGPHQIRKNLRACTLIPFGPGLTVTDEPGIYVEGRFGVRIENVLLCQPAGETPFGRFLGFETLTLCPYDLRPLDRSLLTPEEAAQINAYHTEVRARLLPLLTDEADRQWLRRATEPLVL